PEGLGLRTAKPQRVATPEEVVFARRRDAEAQRRYGAEDPCRARRVRVHLGPLLGRRPAGFEKKRPSLAVEAVVWARLVDDDELRIQRNLVGDLSGAAG